MNLHALPTGLPIPENDGRTVHLIGQKLPDIVLTATSSPPINLAKVPGSIVIYCYLMTGQPGVALPDGWDDIAGARGCTPQSCAFRDYYAEICALGTNVFGLSTQNSAYQMEMAERLHLPFAVLSN